jgi:threonine/homoserine/homoserine lactone efflux protein
LGLGLGGIILAVATALGLAAIFANFPWLVVSLRYVGSGYLIWLGLTMIRDVYKADVGFALTPTVTQRSFGAIVLQGVLVELLNPKTVLFFALFLPPFVDMANGQSGADVTLQLLVLGVLVPLVAIPSDIFVAIMGGKMTRIIGENNAVRKSMAWIGGLFLIVIAMNLHLSFIG